MGLRRAAALLIAAGLAFGCGDAAAPPPGPPQIIASSRTLVDAARPTPPNGAYGGDAARTLETRVWFSAAPPRGAAACSAAGCGLVLLAHGYGGSTARFDAIARFLAAAGYVVTAPSFPLTNDAAPGGHLTFAALADVAQQPGDVSFVISSLLAAARTRGDDLAGRIDPARIGVLGHSLGGATVVAATRLGCCTDPRVGAVVAVAPVWTVLPAFLHEEPGGAGPPTMIVNGSADATVAPALSVELFERIDPPRVYVEVPGAHHSDLIENVGPPAAFIEPTEQAAVAFFDAALGGRQAQLAAVLRDLAAAGNPVRVD